MSRSALLLLVFAPIIACGDPIGPGAAGHISLGAGVSASKWTYLHVRVCRDGSRGSTRVPSPRDARCDFSKQSLLDSAIRLPTEFPVSYRLETGIGQARQKEWLVIAWFSINAESGSPADGEPAGVARFVLPYRHAMLGTWGGAPENVDVLINSPTIKTR